jgi:aminopeptidase
MKEQDIKKMARLAVEIGGNVKTGDTVVIGSDTEAAPLARATAEAAYDAGAADVNIHWSDTASSRTRYLRASDETFDEVPDWIAERFKYLDDKNSVYIHISSEDPDAFAPPVDPGRIKRQQIASGEKLRAHRDNTMSNKVRWSIVGYPGEKWAAKVFPGIPVDEAVEKLWQAILKVSRADTGDPVENWKQHNANFSARVKYLNSKNFTSLRFTNSLGTDLTVGLVENHQWAGGRENDTGGRIFNPNIPTEEIFTMPDRFNVNGRVVASMPLSRNGNLIEGFEFTFKDGAVVSYKADKNEAVLATILDTDEGAKRLGEVALVPADSPITTAGILFLNTLFDENASCHLALGRAYPHNMKGWEGKSEEELTALGMNFSIQHVDFMFGTPDMKIVGTDHSNAESLIFDNGLFAF